MRLKNIVEEDFVNYKKPSLFLATPFCDFKCCKDAGKDVCQNAIMSAQPIHEIDIKHLVIDYLNNPITKSVVIGGLEPLYDSYFHELIQFVRSFREHSDDDIVIYTGYKEDEVVDQLLCLKQFNNIIVKVGRYIPDGTSHFDKILGVNLASQNQYAIELNNWEPSK